jgi:hypothetical protein
MPYILTIGYSLEYTNISYNLEGQRAKKGLFAKSQELFLKMIFLLIYGQRPKIRKLGTLMLYNIQYSKAKIVY